MSFSWFCKATLQTSLPLQLSILVVCMDGSRYLGRKGVQLFPVTIHEHERWHGLGIRIVLFAQMTRTIQTLLAYESHAYYRKHAGAVSEPRQGSRVTYAMLCNR